MAIRRMERAEREDRERRSDAITKVLRRRTKLRLENKNKDFKFKVAANEAVAS